MDIKPFTKCLTEYGATSITILCTSEYTHIQGISDTLYIDCNIKLSAEAKKQLESLIPVMYWVKWGTAENKAEINAKYTYENGNEEYKIL